MTPKETWMLPEGVDEILPHEAWQIETLRRRLLTLFQSWGYDLVIPPILEFSDALMVGVGPDLANLTYKVVDQLTGAALAIRSDMTPQAARMDAHSLQRPGLNRLCYAGQVLYTRARSLLASRSPEHIGVELFGESQPEADLEVISLLITTLQEAGITAFSLDIGHVGIFKAIAQACQLSPQQERELFALLQAKALTDLAQWVQAQLPNPQQAAWVLALPSLCGGTSILAQAETCLAQAPAAVHQALQMLSHITQTLKARHPEVTLYLDLSELRGYHYHTGIVFAAYAQGAGREIASGGRYDHIGESFGRSRPATGFTADLIALERLGSPSTPCAQGIFVPASEDPELWPLLQQLRQNGERVVCASVSHPQYHPYMACNRQLVKTNGHYHIQPLN